METLGKPFPTKRNQLGWPGVGGGGTRTEDGTSRATATQLGRGAQELAKSKEMGGGPTLTEDMASGSEKRAAGQGHLICIVLEKETEQCTKFRVLVPDFRVIASPKSLRVLDRSPADPSVGGFTGPAAPRGQGWSGQRALHTLTSEGHRVLGGRCVPSLGFTVTNASSLVPLLLAWVCPEHHRLPHTD